MLEQANTNADLSTDTFASNQTFPQINITNLSFLTHGGEQHANADIDVILGEDGLHLTLATSVRVGDEASISDLKHALLEELHQVITRTAAIKFEDYPSLLAEGLRSYDDKWPAFAS